MSSPQIIPVIMSGGAGSRLWPLSRRAMPKQLLPLVTPRTMIQETAVRFEGPEYGPPVFICNALHAAEIRSQMAEIDHEVGAILVEPVGRNTAPCAVVAACHVQSVDPEALVLLVPADHHVRLPEAFRKGVDTAVLAAKGGRLVTFGITPDRAETGYGYIQSGGSIGGGVLNVAAFKEKPDAETALGYFESGHYLWNAGIFLFSPAAFLAEIKSFAPDIRKQAEQAFVLANQVAGDLMLDRNAFAKCPSESIDYAVMEKTEKAAVVPFDIGWSDIGSFASLHEVTRAPDGNRISGDVVVVDVSNSIIQTDGPLVSAVGVKDIAIIVHDGQILVAHLDAAQDVKKIVDELKAKGRTDRL